MSTTLRTRKAIFDLYTQFISSNDPNDIWIRIDGSNDEIKITIDWLMDKLIVLWYSKGRHNDLKCTISEQMLLKYYNEIQ